MALRFGLALVIAASVALLLVDPGRHEAAGAISRAPAPAETADPIELAAATDPVLVGRPVPTATPLQPADVTVRVLGPGDRPLAGAFVQALLPGAREMSIAQTARTGVDGTAVLRSLPLDGTCKLIAMRRSGRPQEKGCRSTWVEATQITIGVPFGLDLEIRAFDAVTGRQLASEPVVPTNAMPGDVSRAPFALEAPAGYVAWDEQVSQVQVSRWATRLVAHHPLRREARVRVRVLDHEGLAETEARLTTFRVAGRRVGNLVAEDRSGGLWRLHGVPFFAGETLRVEATSPRLVAAHGTDVTLPAHPAESTDLVVQLPPPENEPLSGGHDTCRFVGRRDRRHPSKPRGDAGPLRIRLLRSSGAPAPGVYVSLHGVRIAQVDERGEAVFRDLAPGTHTASARAFGLLRTEGRIDLRSGEPAELVLREPGGGTIELTVTDGDGVPLPYARFRVVGPYRRHWIDEQNGVQRIDPFVDASGRRLLERVEPSEVEVHVDWGSRHATKKLRVADGRVEHLHLVMDG